MLIGISGRIGAGKDTLAKFINYTLLKREVEKGNKSIHSVPAISDLFADKPISGPFEIKKYAKKLKVIASILTGIPEEDFEKQEVKNSTLPEEWWYYYIASKKMQRFYYPNKEDNDMCEERYLVKPTVRQLLQELGTEAMRDNIHPNIWVNTLFADYKGVYLGLPSEYEEGKNLTYPNWIITDVRFPNEAEAIKERGGIIIRINRPAYNTTARLHPSETSLDRYQFDLRFTIEEGATHQLLQAAENTLEFTKFTL